MNQAHLHLLLNHLPVTGTLFGVIILLGGYIFRHVVIRRTALVVFVLSALFAVPAYLTGEGAEEVIEGLAGISESVIEPHEDLASVYLWVVGALGVLSLITLYLDTKKMKISSFMYFVVLLFSMISVGVSARLANTGGEIRHPEIRNEAQANIQKGVDQDED